MAKEIVINVEQTETRVAVVADGMLEEYYFERSGNKRITGNIYRAKVVKIMPGIQAAFVNIGLRKNGFLHISDIIGEGAAIEELAGGELEEIKPAKSTARRGRSRSGARSRAGARTRKHQRLIEDVLKQDDDLVVQVVKESIGTKGPRLSTNISLPGRYLVLLPTTARLGISRRVTNQQERDRLREMAETLPVPKGMGLIMRTYARDRTKRECTRDLKMLVSVWKEIEAHYRDADKPGVIHNESELLTRVVRDALAEGVDRIVVDSRREYRDIKSFVGASARDGLKVVLHTARTPIFEAYGLDKEIEKACRRRVWLKCGGYIVIERSEAMATIDVNTGRHQGKGDAEDTILTTNLEAAEEAARQLKLRNMGGLIVIDFIDMRSRANQRKVFSTLQAALKKDKARTTVLPISKLGLVEMTRERDKESLGEEHYGECPYCRGTGRVKLLETVSIEIQRALRKLVAMRSGGEYKVCAHPDVIDRLKNEDASAVDRLLKRSRLIVEFLPITDYHVEEWHCYPTQANGPSGDLQSLRPPRE